MSLLLRRVKIVDPQSSYHDQVADILIQDGSIASIGADLSIDSNTQIIDIPGAHAAPGFIDVFADYREPGYEHKETIDSGLRAAAAGGFTQVLVVPNTAPATTTKAAVQYLLQRAKGNIVSLRPLGALSQDIEGKALAEMLDMQAQGALAFTDGWKPMQSANLMLKALEYVKVFDGVVIQIPMDASLSAGGLMHEGITSTRLGMPGIPVLAETTFLNRDLELLKYTGSKLHVTGISTAAGVAMVRQAKAEGSNVTCSVTPYHLALTDEALTSYDSIYKVSPVLRSEEDRQALIAGLADGTIDCIASHHRPQEWDSKAKEFEYTGDGMNVQESAFPIVWNSMQGQVSLNRVIDALSTAPRRIIGLQSSGLDKNTRAELTIFTSEDKTTLQPSAVQSLSRNNPFIGKELQGRIIGIVSNGQSHINH